MSSYSHLFYSSLVIPSCFGFILNRKSCRTYDFAIKINNMKPTIGEPSSTVGAAFGTFLRFPHFFPS